MAASQTGGRGAPPKGEGEGDIAAAEALVAQVEAGARAPTSSVMRWLIVALCLGWSAFQLYIAYVPFDQFLAREWTKGHIRPDEAFAKQPEPVMLHSHCQQKAVIGSGSTKAVLGWTSDQVQELDAGCCGMAGSFGYGHYDLSMKIGDGRLFPAVREHDGEVVSCGFSCRHQIHDGTGKTPSHVAQVLKAALKPGG